MMVTSKPNYFNVFLPYTRESMLMLLLVLATLGGCNSPYSSFYWTIAERQAIHVLVPEGYEGPVLIAWQIPNGKVAETKDNTLIYRLGTDGVLLLKDVPPGGIGNWLFEYEMADKQLVSIPSSACFDNSPEMGVVVCTGGRYYIFNERQFHPNQSFYIIELDNKEAVMGVGSKIVDSLHRKYIVQLTIPDK